MFDHFVWGTKKKHLQFSFSSDLKHRFFFTDGSHETFNKVTYSLWQRSSGLIEAQPFPQCGSWPEWKTKTQKFQGKDFKSWQVSIKVSNIIFDDHKKSYNQPCAQPSHLCCYTNYIASFCWQMTAENTFTLWKVKKRHFVTKILNTSRNSKCLNQYNKHL